MARGPGVQSLVRGLRVLEVINERPGLCVSEIAARCRLPRTSTHRFLQTLTLNGFARRDERTQQYFPTHRVTNLAAGFDRTAHLTEQARQLLEQLAESITWPMHFSTQNDMRMEIRASTDHVSPLAVEKLLPGQRIPLLQCAAGIAWLGSQPRGEQVKLVDAALQEKGDVVWSRLQVEGALIDVQKRGFAIFRRPQRRTVMVGLSVPVRVDGEVQGAISIRFAESAVSVDAGRDKFLPRLTAAATLLGDAAH